MNSSEQCTITDTDAVGGRFDPQCLTSCTSAYVLSTGSPGGNQTPNAPVVPANPAPVEQLTGPALQGQTTSSRHRSLGTTTTWGQSERGW